MTLDDTCQQIAKVEKPWQSLPSGWQADKEMLGCLPGYSLPNWPPPVCHMQVFENKREDTAMFFAEIFVNTSKNSYVTKEWFSGT